MKRTAASGLLFLVIMKALPASANLPQHMDTVMSVMNGPHIIHSGTEPVTVVFNESARYYYLLAENINYSDILKKLESAAKSGTFLKVYFIESSGAIIKAETVKHRKNKK